MKAYLALLSLIGIPSLVNGDIYFKETFDDDSWKTRWVQSNHLSSYGAFNVSTGDFFADEIGSRALQTTQDARYYAISAPFDKEFDNKGKPLVVQYSVKFERGANCAGGYLKILPPGINPKDFHGETPYNIMFGPDICGPDQKLHFIMHYKGKNHMVRDPILPATDQLTHLYTLIVHPNQTYQVLVDNSEEAHGSLIDDFDFLPPKKINDPKVKKSDDWDERETIPDPDDFMPDDWEDEPEMIPDPDDLPPDYWDETVDGEWYSHMIPNPAWKGEWEPRQIPNPKYNGTWVHPQIDNPAYYFDTEIYAYKSAHVSFELWQVTSGSLFDDMLITDSIEEAKKFADETFFKKQMPEWEAKERMEEADRERIRKQKEEEEKRKAEQKNEGDKKGHEEL